MKPFIPAAAVAAVAFVATAHGQSAPTTLKLTEGPAKLSYVDAPPKKGLKKPSPGDVFVIVGKVTGDDTGTTNLVCTVTGKVGSECQGTVRLAHGSLTLAGFSTFAGNTDSYAVTGGTGDYAGKSGVAVVTGNGTDHIAITFS